jgi:tetratricopeptide (TPR) repeat protein
VIVACFIVVCTAIGALAWLNQHDKTMLSGVAVPTFSGEPNVVVAKYRQAAIKAVQGNSFAEAESFLDLALKEAPHCESGEDVAATINVELARVYMRQDKLSDATKAANKALALRERLHQNNQRPMADVFVCIGDIALARDDHKAAEGYFEKALAIQQRECGPMHEDVGTTLNELGRAVEGEGNLARAESYYKQALAIRQDALGPNKGPVAETLMDYARLLKRMGRASEADKAKARAAAILSSARN